MKNCKQLMFVFVVLAAFIATLVLMPARISAGDLEPPGPPEGTMKTLDEIYDKLEVIDSKFDGGAPVAKTGQTSTYATDDDGYLQRGVTWPNPRFTDNSDGTVTDNLTGLMWTKNANIYGERTWSDALSDCNSCTEGGYTDWTLPNVKELFSLIDFEHISPALPDTAGTRQWSWGDPFTFVLNKPYWSSTTLHEGYSDLANTVLLNDGRIWHGDKSSSTDKHVWCVRSEP